MYKKELYSFKFKLAMTFCIVVNSQHSLFRINDPQKQKVLYTLEINNIIPMCARPCVFTDHYVETFRVSN